MATSFISEHSAEYILVPKLIKILERDFQKVIPLYFLSMREGSRVSRDCDQHQPIRVINVFARRPKVSKPYSSQIEVKLNSVLFEKANLSAEAGIHTFAGVPLISSLMDLELDAPCAWFSLSGPIDVDIHFQLSTDGTVIRQLPQSSAAKLLPESELAETAFLLSREMTWSIAIEYLRRIRRYRSPLSSYWFMGGSGYQPFSIILVPR